MHLLGDQSWTKLSLRCEEMLEKLFTKYEEPRQADVLNLVLGFFAAVTFFLWDFLLNFILQKAKVTYSIHQNTWNYNVCSIQLETKAICLHKISV